MLSQNPYLVIAQNLKVWWQGLCPNELLSLDLPVLQGRNWPRQNEITKTMMDEEFQIVKMWVNEILTEDTSRQRAKMKGTILQLDKGGGTNKTSDQRPVVLLNSVYQLLNYVINERLEKIAEPANILEPGQSGDRQGRCVGINMQKVHCIQQEARRMNEDCFYYCS